MAHIRQKNSSEEDGKAYTVVLNTADILEEDECLTDHPDRFEIVDSLIPDDAQFLRYRD